MLVYRPSGRVKSAPAQLRSRRSLSRSTPDLIEPIEGLGDRTPWGIPPWLDFFKESSFPCEIESA
jgi:hypothetical protein